MRIAGRQALVFVASDFHAPLPELGKALDEMLQLYGGYGYMMEYPITRAFVDSRVTRIYGGTSEVMKELISRSL